MSEKAISPQRSGHFFQALRSPSFTFFWLGQAISVLGNGAYSIALPWLVLSLTGSAVAMASLLVVSSIPSLFFLLIGGVAADRLSRRLVLLVSDGGRGLLLLIVVALAWLHLLQIWHLFVLALLFGTIGAFFGPAYRAITPQLVPKDDLKSANALTEFSSQLGRLIGPLIGAGLIAILDPVSAIAFDALTFVVSAISLFAIAHIAMPQIEQEAGNTQKRRGFVGVMLDIKDGFVYILGSTWLLWTIISPAFSNAFISGAFGVSLPKLILNTYHSAWLLGTMATVDGIGVMCAAFLVGQLHLRRRGVLAFLGATLGGVALFIFGLPLPLAIVPVVFLVASFLLGFGFSVLQTIWVTLLQELVPSEKLGRVASVDLFGSLALVPLGYLLAGWITDGIGASWLFLIGGAVIVVLHLFPIFLRDIRTME